METVWKQILVALLMGVLLPRAMLFLTPDKMQALPGETVEQTQAQESTQPPQEQAHLISVCMDSGQIVSMELESYVYGVVLAEMPAYFGEDALKAQAVVARTYALRRLTLGDRHTGGAVCTDSGCCQAYISENAYLQTQGGVKDAQKVRSAVEATAGQVLTYQGKLAESTYFSCSGGRTEDAQAVWGGAVSYLQAVDSPGEESAKYHTVTKFFTREAFAQALGKTPSGSCKSWLGAVSYTNGGGVEQMYLFGTAYTGKQLQKLLKLNSIAFTMEAKSDGIEITTHGKGHRVGMSQYGADAMASGGSVYTEILSHYYPGTRIDKYSPVG